MKDPELRCRGRNERLHKARWPLELIRGTSARGRGQGAGGNAVEPASKLIGQSAVPAPRTGPRLPRLLGSKYKYHIYISSHWLSCRAQAWESYRIIGLSDGFTEHILCKHGRCYLTKPYQAWKWWSRDQMKMAQKKGTKGTKRPSQPETDFLRYAHHSFGTVLKMARSKGHIWNGHWVIWVCHQHLFCLMTAAE